MVLMVGAQRLVWTTCTRILGDLNYVPSRRRPAESAKCSLPEALFCLSSRSESVQLVVGEACRNSGRLGAPRRPQTGRFPEAQLLVHDAEMSAKRIAGDAWSLPPSP